MYDMYVVHMYHGACVEVRGQLREVFHYFHLYVNSRDQM